MLDNITLKNFLILMKCGTKVDDKFYPQIFLGKFFDIF